ncbi:MAG TPA: energy transducer TonB [Rhizomicrobium sp.]|jgi:TonB family protein|nr:energy transducer TonB [Rhizomicrobium sp.]
MKCGFALLLLSAQALAQAPQQATQFPQPGPPHLCVRYYPPIAVRLHQEGITTLAFQVTPAGAVANVTIKKSSGHASLDDASVKCVQQWQYSTAKNAPPEETKQVNIVWKLGPSLLYAVESAALDCIRKAKPGGEALARANKDSEVNVVFHESGYVSVSLTQPSGSDELDHLLVACLYNLPADIVVPNSTTELLIPFCWKNCAQDKTDLRPKRNANK